MKHSILLIAAGAALELAHSRVFSGAAGGDSNTLAMVEGKLANLDEVLGSSLRVGLLLLVLGVFLAIRGQ